MALEINSLSGGAIQSTGDGSRIDNRAEQTPSSSPTSTSASTGGDRVSLTSSATMLKTLEDRISSLPVVDSQRVEETRHALATGTHEVDPVSTADSMLEVERSFG